MGQNQKSRSGIKNIPSKDKGKKYFPKEKIINKKKDILSQLTQKTINNLILLQKRPIESWGVIDEYGNLLDVRYGTEYQVEDEIIPDRGICDFHIHPDTVPPKVSYPKNVKLSKKENKCAIESELIRSLTPSPPDIFIAFKFRSRIDMPSLIIAKDTIIQYVLKDKDKYQQFLKLVKQNKGDANQNEIGNFLGDQFEKIKNELRNEILDDQQNFSYCGEKDLRIRLLDQWNTFLKKEVGIELSYRPIKYKKF